MAGRRDAYELLLIEEGPMVRRITTEEVTADGWQT